MNQDSPLPPDTRGKLLRRVAIIAAVSGLFFIPYIFIPDHWVTTLPDGRMEIIFLRDPLYTLIKYLPVLGGAICIAGGILDFLQKIHRRQRAAAGLCRHRRGNLRRWPCVEFSSPVAPILLHRRSGRAGLLLSLPQLARRTNRRLGPFGGASPSARKNHHSGNCHIGFPRE